MATATIPTTLPPLPRSRIGASAVLAGLFASLATALLVFMLGAAIGVSALQPTVGAAKGLGIGESVWLIVSLCVGAFVGAFVAATAAPLAGRQGLLHGFVTWAVVTVVGASLAGGAISGLLGVAKDTAQAAATSPTLSQQAPDLRARASTAVDSTRARLSNPQVVQQAKTGATVGAWGLFVALALPLGCALLGGALADRSTRHAEGPLLRRREVVRTTPVEPTGPVEPLPA